MLKAFESLMGNITHTPSSPDFTQTPARFTGECPICEKATTFEITGPWLRDQFFCTSCGSIPRERALMLTLQRFFPDWKSKSVHECSPVNRGTSVRLRGCASYTPTQFDPDTPAGQIKNGYRSEDLENQTFADETFDLVISQDVFEHIFDPAAAIKEIARTLKPGGAYLMTVPIINKNKPSQPRASKVNGEIVMHGPVEYHGNPMSSEGSLVTMDWGYDIADFLSTHSGMSTTLVHIDDLAHGIRAEYIEVVVARKPNHSGVSSMAESASIA